MVAHILGMPVEELLGTSWGVFALTVGIVFATAGLLLRRALRHLQATGRDMRAKVGRVTRARGRNSTK